MKRKLHLDELEVDPFETLAPEGGAGTVHAHDNSNPCMATGDPTCPYSCEETCPLSCNPTCHVSIGICCGEES